LALKGGKMMRSGNSALAPRELDREEQARLAPDPSSAAASGLLQRLDARLPLSTLLLAFWSMFWLLNGLDKFFNAPGFFGVTRDAAFVEYFGRLNLPPALALTSLYACGISEILLGLCFAAALVLGAPVLINLCFKGSMVIFITFSTADVLFGDRAELWEHGTFLLLVLASVVVLRADHKALRAPVW
jgi:hypothetical protein